MSKYPNARFASQKDPMMGQMSGKTIASIGVVIPVHGNYRHVIERTLDAVKDQIAQPRVVILVIDGPDPDIEAVARNHASELEILVLPRNTGGPATPRNEGAAFLVAKHDVDAIWFLDADDIPHPRFLEVVSQAMEKNPEADLVCTGFSLWQQNTERPSLDDKALDEGDSMTIDLDWYLGQTGSMLPSFTVVRTRSFSSIRQSGAPFEPAYRNNQDYDMFVRILHLQRGIRIDWQGGDYRLHPEAISAQGSEAWMCRASVNRDLKDWFQEQGADELAKRMVMDEGSAIRKAARHLWRRARPGDRHTAIRLLVEDIQEHRTIHSLVLLLLMPLGLDAKARRIPQDGDTRQAVASNTES